MTIIVRRSFDQDRDSTAFETGAEAFCTAYVRRNLDPMFVILNGSVVASDGSPSNISSAGQR